MKNESWRRNRGGGIVEEASWRGNPGACIMEEWRQPGGGSQEEAVRRRQLEGTRRHPGGTKKHPGGTRRHPEGSQEAPRSVSVSVFVSVPILLLLLCVFKGPRRLRAVGQRLRDPR